MDTITPQNIIKPLFSHSIHIKSPDTYKNYLIKRSKHVVTFKFSRQTGLSGNIKNSQKKFELKLQKSLSLLKSVKKVDLSHFQVSNKLINHNRLQSCFKHVSKISTLQWTRNQLNNQLKTNLLEKSFKHLPRLHNLSYELINQGSPMFIQPRDEYYEQRIKDDPLNHSKYHSKLQSLQLETSGHGVYFSRVFSEGLKRYPLSLKNLTITSLLNIDFPFHFKRFLQLESVNIKFSQDYTGSDGLIQQNLGPLSELSNLQALSLEFNGQTIPTIHPILLKLAERKVLKKLSLIFSSCALIDRKILEALQKLDQLTHFHFQIHIVDSQSDEVLKLVAGFLENMKQLEDLKLSIFKSLQFESFDTLELICQKINCLEFLKHLDLCFVPLVIFTKIPNFLLHLENLFTKPIKLESLSLHCVQLDPTKALLDLANLLKNSSTSLQKLKTSFGYCVPDLQSQQLIIQFLKSLSNIQVLELHSLQIKEPNFFGQISEAISPLKGLREFLLGDIADQVPEAEYRKALVEIITKRELTKFRCQTSSALLMKCGFQEDRNGKLKSLKIRMKKVAKKNPSLESVYLAFPYFHFDFLKEYSE